MTLDEFIEEAQPSDSQRDLVSVAVDSCSYTTSVMLALSEWLEHVGDETGAKLMLELARQFAEYERETV